MRAANGTLYKLFPGSSLSRNQRRCCAKEAGNAYVSCVKGSELLSFSFKSCGISKHLPGTNQSSGGSDALTGPCSFTSVIEEYSCGTSNDLIQTDESTHCSRVDSTNDMGENRSSSIQSDSHLCSFSGCWTHYLASAKNTFLQLRCLCRSHAQPLYY